MTKDEALKQALEALEGGHLDRAYGYIQAALAQPAREPLTEAEIADIVVEMNGNEPTGLFWRDLTRAIEAAHGIGKKT